MDCVFNAICLPFKKSQAPALSKDSSVRDTDSENGNDQPAKLIANDRPTPNGQQNQLKDLQSEEKQPEEPTHQRRLSQDNSQGNINPPVSTTTKIGGMKRDNQNHIPPPNEAPTFGNQSNMEEKSQGNFDSKNESTSKRYLIKASTDTCCHRFNWLSLNCQYIFQHYFCM